MRTGLTEEPDVARAPLGAPATLPFTVLHSEHRLRAAALARGRAHGSQAALDRAAEAAREWTGAEHAVVCLADGGAPLVVARSTGVSETTLRFLESLPVEQTMCARVVEYGVPLEADGAGIAAIVGPLPVQAQSALSVPVEVLGSRVGTLCAFHASARGWSQDDVRALREVAGVISDVLSPPRPLRQAADDDGPTPTSGVVRLDGDLLPQVNDADELGIGGPSLWDVLPLDGWDAVRPHFELALSGEVACFSMPTPRGRLDVELDPQPDGVIATYRCTPEPEDGRGRLELSALMDATSIDDVLLELMSDGVLLTDAEGRVLHRNARARSFEPVRGIETVDQWRAHTLLLDADGRWLAPEEHPTAVALRTGRSQFDVQVTVVSAAGRRRVCVSTVVLHGRADGVRLITVLRDMTELQEAREARSRATVRDRLTGLLTRPALEERMREALLLARARRRHLALLLCDVNGMKRINDLFGTERGDEVLRRCAERLDAAAPGALVARLAGDEFAVAAEVDDDLEAMALAQHLRGAVGVEVIIGDASHRPDLRVGLALGRSTTAHSTLFTDATLALGDAESDEAVPIVLADEARRHAAGVQRRTEHELRSVIQAGVDLELHYQPIFATEDGALTDFEALVRWRHPERGLVPPGDFVPLAEQAGLIGALGDWVLAEACRQASAWRAELQGPAPRVHVNLAASQFADASLPARLQVLLTRFGLPASAIGLEVTESQVMHDDRPLAQLREMGIQLSLDDFGTGFSSLARLQDLPIDVLKVDRAFVSGPRALARRHALLKSIVTMGRGLGLEVVAEGIETEQQAARARELGCHRLQGFHLGRPAPATAWRSVLA